MLAAQDLTRRPNDDRSDEDGDGDESPCPTPDPASKCRAYCKASHGKLLLRHILRKSEKAKVASNAEQLWLSLETQAEKDTV
jgi:hypothetical protein